MLRDIAWLLWVLTVTVGLGAGANVPYVFGDGGPLPLDYARIADIDDAELLAFSTTAGPGASSAGEVRTIRDLREELSGKVDVTDPSTRETAVVLAAKYPGDRTIDQICSIYEYLKEGWRYVSDPSGIDYYQSASESIRIGEKADCAGAGDCDDFAIMMSALIESIGGTARIVLAYNQSEGHAYTEVYLGRLDQGQVEQIVKWLKREYNVGEIYTHVDSDTNEVWLNLDWSAENPGGPFYRADKQVVVLVRGEGYEKMPLNFATDIIETWMKTFGGTKEDMASSVQETSDGGYITAGYTKSYGSGGILSGADFWLVKTDSRGNKLWDKTFGGAYGDGANFVRETNDGGYIITGGTKCYGAGESDFWLVKTDSRGNKLWDKTFGGSAYDEANSVQVTSDGGYIVIGFTESYGAGGADFWLVKTDSRGNKLWDKTFGGSEYDWGWSAQETSDDGYIVTGVTESYGAGGADFWLVKTDSWGNKLWDKTFGGAHGDGANFVQEMSDGGYIIRGSTESYGAGGSDFWLVKTDSRGNKLWDRTFGETSNDGLGTLHVTRDGGYIITGATYSHGAGDSDFWLVKTDSKGNKIWDRTFGGEKEDMASSVQETSDGGYIIAGWTKSYGSGDFDALLIKTDSEGNVDPS